MGIPALASAAGAASAGSSAGSSAAGAAAVSGGMGIISSIINQSANKRKQKRQQQYTEKNMKLANDYSKQLMDYENAINNENWQKEIEREDYLLANGKKIEAKALRDAGFNPALANGVGAAMPTTPQIGSASSTASASSGAGAAPTNIDGSAIAMDAIAAYKSAEELNLMRAQSRKTNADAHAVELDNEGLEESNSILNALSERSVTIGEDGRFYAKGEYDDEPHVIDFTPTTKAGYDALQHYRQMESEHSVYQSKEYRANLEKAVAKLQIEDDTILQSLKSMPNELLRELSTKNDLTSLETELKASEKYFWKGVGEMNNDTVKFLSSMFLTFFNKR